MAHADNRQFIKALRDWTHIFMHQSMDGFMTHARSQNLSMSQIGTLMHIHRMGTCGVGDISDDMGVTTAAVSQLLDRLVQAGLVERAEDPHDRRAKRIELTELGDKAVHEAMEARLRWFDDLASLLSEPEREAATSSLRLLANRASSINRERS